METTVKIQSKNVNSIIAKKNITLENVLMISVSEAKELWAKFRTDYGFAEIAVPLLTPPSANEKLSKSVAYGLALSPATSSGYNTCPMSTASCRAGCVAYAGKGAYGNVQRARKAKTMFLVEHSSAFFRLLIHEINTAYQKHGDKLVIRLNTFSDINFAEFTPWIFDLFQNVTFYDYTKVWSRANHGLSNYHIALSDSERISESDVLTALGAGYSVAMVVNVRKGEPMPTEWRGHKVVDADLSDRWIIDHENVIGGLRPKGFLKIDSPMVRKIA
jgi:hypothetical protein